MYQRLIPESPAKCYVDQSIHQRAMLELDLDWARDVHPLLDCEIAGAICVVWETVEDYLRGRHNFTSALEALTIHADGTIEVEMVQHEHFDSVTLQNIIEAQPSFITSTQWPQGEGKTA